MNAFIAKMTMNAFLCLFKECPNAEKHKDSHGNNTVSAEQFARSSVESEARKAFNAYKRSKKKWKQSIY